MKYTIFPVVENGKKPAVKNWQTWALNATEKQIENYRKAHPNTNWGLFCEGMGLTILDIDGKNGRVELKKLQKQYGKLPKTKVVQTPNGYHFYFSGTIKSSIGKLAKNVDVKGKGAYVLLPGSKINGKLYKTISESESIPETPTWLTYSPKPEPIRLDDRKLIQSGNRNITLTRLGGALRAKGLNEEAIYNALVIVNRDQTERPLDLDEVKKISASVARYTPDTAESAAVFLESNAKSIYLKAANTVSPAPPARKWVMSERYIKGFISVLVAPGGIGKSSLTLLDAVSIATGKSLSGFRVAERGAVWLYNAEDPQEELDRRLAALSLCHKIKLEDLPNLYLTSGDDQSFIVATNGQSGNAILNTELQKTIIKTIKDNGIILFIVDPFVLTHELSENDNTKISAVVRYFRQIAKEAECAVCLVHHTSKAGMALKTDDPNMARGASSLIGAARIAHTLLPLSDTERGELQIHENQRHRFVKLTGAKNNLSILPVYPTVYTKESMTLLNGESVGAFALSEVSFKNRPIVYELTEIMDVLPQAMEEADKVNLSILCKTIKGRLSTSFKDKSDATVRRYIIKALKGCPIVLGYRYSHNSVKDDGPNKSHWIIREKVKQDESVSN